jgi:hypothetical protein
MALLIKKKPTAQSAVQHVHSGEVVTEEHITEVVDAPAAMLPAVYCTVGFEASMTINLGNYNSTRLQASIQIPCTHSEIDEVFAFAETWINQKMEKLTEGVTGAQG